jgi:hypothetical protein
MWESGSTNVEQTLPPMQKNNMRITTQKQQCEKNTTNRKKIRQ